MSNGLALSFSPHTRERRLRHNHTRPSAATIDTAMTLHGVVDACFSLCVGEVLVSDTFFSAEA
jgi:hypothetical protein